MILLDLSAFFYRSVFPNKEGIIENPQFIAHLLTTQILQYAKKFGASKTNKMVLCLDSHSWRYDYYETNKVKFPEYAELGYKKGRSKDSDLDWDTLKYIVNDLMESFKQNTDYFVIKVHGAEGDDVIAILTNEYKSKEDIFLLAWDKDFQQLQSFNVHQYNPIKQSFNPEIDVNIFLQCHICTGDRVDGIPAIRPRLGEKTAIKILKDIPDLLATNPDMRERYEFNKKLIDFSEIPSYIEEAILTEFSNQTHSFNSTNLLKTFMKFNMSKLSESINEFKLSDKEIKTTLNQHFITAKRNETLLENNLEEFFS